MATRYETRPLRIREAFVVKYEAPRADGAPEAGPRQAGLDMHRDGTLLNAIIMLSSSSDYEGGGMTFAPPLDATYRCERGDCLCSSGQLLHGAVATRQKTRAARCLAHIQLILALLEVRDQLIELPISFGSLQPSVHLGTTARRRLDEQLIGRTPVAESHD